MNNNSLLFMLFPIVTVSIVIVAFVLGDALM